MKDSLDLYCVKVVEDQSVLICMSGLIISVVAGSIINILRTYYGLGRASRHLLYMVPPALIPLYWIYKSEKLQEVMVRWVCCLRRRKSRIILVWCDEWLIFSCLLDRFYLYFYVLEFGFILCFKIDIFFIIFHLVSCQYCDLLGGLATINNCFLVSEKKDYFKTFFYFPYVDHKVSWDAFLVRDCFPHHLGSLNPLIATLVSKSLHKY